MSRRTRGDCRAATGGLVPGLFGAAHAASAATDPTKDFPTAGCVTVADDRATRTRQVGAMYPRIRTTPRVAPSFLRPARGRVNVILCCWQ